METIYDVLHTVTATYDVYGDTSGHESISCTSLSTLLDEVQREYTLTDDEVWELKTDGATTYGDEIGTETLTLSSSWLGGWKARF